MNPHARIYDLTFEERPGYLIARIASQTVYAEMAREYLKEIADKAIAKKYDRIIIERKIPVMLSDVDLYETTKYFLELINSRRVAFVNPYAQIKKDMEFAILIGKNRGANYRLFDNVPAAARWLRDENSVFTY